MDSTRRSTRASSRRAESQPAPHHQQQQVPRVTETPSPQHQAADSDTALVLRALATQVTSLTKKLDGMQDENSVLRKLALSSQTRQESTVAHTGKAGHFTKPACFTGKNLTVTRHCLDTDMIKINWVGSLLAEQALVWHIHRANRHAPPQQSDNWTSYSEAFKFLELNTSGQALGLGERRMITKALPRDIVRMTHTWNRTELE
ncbi:hypothetical protein E4U60_004142 [Claviceps pazoutovae]|uniref:Uncharacterized protein n=1 Tax=Claviceps pazoutovae TaxID=1649127 RepID=A0A9P7SFY4_9HYPO|nr:hypothetical protein E4U60_004142 [Claviceps pazoutovae]